MALVAMLNSQGNLNRIFNDLKSKNEDRRLKAAEELRETAEIAARELSEENFVRFTNDINKRFFDWTHGNDNNEKLGAM
ncbi:unnamed protein product [Rhizopus microsporus]